MISYSATIQTSIQYQRQTKYNQAVTLTFRNMAAKVRVALYETVPGYSIKNVKFYTAEAAEPTAPNDLGYWKSEMQPSSQWVQDVLPQSGDVTCLLSSYWYNPS